MKFQVILSAVLILLTSSLFANDDQQQAIELGKVHWLRNINEAVAFSEQKERPIFILFQEVPGCATCRNYGNAVLSHPLIVEAIETLFIPLAIHNNKQGEDARVLKYFGEPSWNNPVVRIVNSNKQAVVPRLSGNYSALGLVEAMLQALTLSGLAAPNYLELLAEELRAERSGTQTATFSMYCFWTGEGTYGQLDGVVATEPGFMDGREVVQVEYNPAIISFEELAKKGKAASCASKTYVDDRAQREAARALFGSSGISNTKAFRPDGEPKYYLSRTSYRYIPMTPLQAARANSLVGKGENPNHLLSPRQLELLEQMKKRPELKWKNVIGVDFKEAWRSVEQRL